jgi:predicted transcriptional regulator
MSKKLLEIASEIVQAQASNARMSAEEIESALLRTFNMLHKMQLAEQDGRPLDLAIGPEEAAEEASALQVLDPSKSIQKNKVICMECGAEFKQLTANHLHSHDLSPRDYKKKWGFPLKQPLTAKMLTAARSKAAKLRGLPPKLKEYIEKRRVVKAEDLPPVVSAPPVKAPRAGRRKVPAE